MIIVKDKKKLFCTHNAATWSLIENRLFSDVFRKMLKMLKTKPFLVALMKGQVLTTRGTIFACVTVFTSTSAEPPDANKPSATKKTTQEARAAALPLAMSPAPLMNIQ
jgi:hypothetical protein